MGWLDPVVVVSGGESDLGNIDRWGDIQGGDARLPWGSARSYVGSPFPLHNRKEDLTSIPILE